MNIMISFVIPVYKVEPYLNTCVDSILSQFNNEIEVILVDDGSPDKCGQLCNEYAKADKRIKVIHKENEGVSLARMDGIDKASGEYIVCIDSDDWISSDYAKIIKDTIDTFAPDVIRYGYFRASENRIDKYYPEIREGLYDKQRIVNEIYPILIEGKKGVTFINGLWSCVIKRDLLQQYCLRNVKVIMGEDAASLKPCIFYANSMVVLNECLYFYRQIKSSVIHRKPVLPWSGPILIKNHYTETIGMKNECIYNQIETNAIHNLFNVFVSWFNDEKNYTEISVDIKKQLERDDHSFVNSCKLNKYSWKIKLAQKAITKYRVLLFLYNRIYWRVKK